MQRTLAENLSLFEGDDWRARIQTMRTEALRAIEFFSGFEAHLVGSALYGTATEFSVITLHLYSDDFEQVVWRLSDAKIGFHLTQTVLKRDAKSRQEFPSLELSMNDFDYEIIVFPLSFRFNPPASPLDGKPYQRGDTKKIKQLLETNTVLFGKYLMTDLPERSVE